MHAIPDLYLFSLRDYIIIMIEVIAQLLCYAFCIIHSRGLILKWFYLHSQVSVGKRAIITGEELLDSALFLMLENILKVWPHQRVSHYHIPILFQVCVAHRLRLHIPACSSSWLMSKLGISFLGSPLPCPDWPTPNSCVLWGLRQALLGSQVCRSLGHQPLPHLEVKWGSSTPCWMSS